MSCNCLSVVGLAAVIAGDRRRGGFVQCPDRESWRDCGIVKGEIARSYRGCPPVVDCRVGDMFGDRVSNRPLDQKRRLVLRLCMGIPAPSHEARPTSGLALRPCVARSQAPHANAVRPSASSNWQFSPAWQPPVSTTHCTAHFVPPTAHWDSLPSLASASHRIASREADPLDVNPLPLSSTGPTASSTLISSAERETRPTYHPPITRRGTAGRQPFTSPIRGPRPSSRLSSMDSRRQPLL